MRLHAIAIILIGTSGAAPTDAFAATLNVVGGQLAGASDVNVDGALYDVSFVDGTCIALFSGCEGSEDFTFQTPESATAAAAALLEQVFVDSVLGDFDTTPNLTKGCDAAAQFQCWTLVPFDVGEAENPLESEPVRTRAARNEPVEADDAVNSFSSRRTLDLTTGSANAQNRSVYAVFSPVPEPSTGLLLLAGLGVLAARRRVYASSSAPESSTRRN